MARGTIITRTVADGSKRYDTVIRINGKQRWQTFTRKKDAEDHLDHDSTDVRDGTYREIKKATFGEYIKHWKDTYLIAEKLKPSTIGGYGSIIDAHLKPEFEHRSMQGIDSAQITQFEARLLQRTGMSRTTVRNVMTLLGRVFKNARKEHFVRVSPMDDIDRLKVDKTKKGRALKPEEIHRLLEQCAGNLRLIVLTALLSGLRRSEIFALHWTDDKKDPRSYVDFESDVIHVRKALFFRHGRHLRIEDKDSKETVHVFTAPKSSQSVRVVPLSATLKRELKEHYLRAKDKEGLIFQTSNGTPLDPHNVCRYKPERKDDGKGESANHKKAKQPRAHFSDAVSQAEIGPVRFHDLRHTYGSMKIDQGENIYDVQRWMGHSSIQVTIDIYGHPLTDRGKEAAAKTDTVLFGAAKA
jgi:integrase